MFWKINFIDRGNDAFRTIPGSLLTPLFPQRQQKYSESESFKIYSWAVYSVFKSSLKFIRFEHEQIPIRLNFIFITVVYLTIASC